MMDNASDNGNNARCQKRRRTSLSKENINSKSVITNGLNTPAKFRKDKNISTRTKQKQMCAEKATLSPLVLDNLQSTELFGDLSFSASTPDNPNVDDDSSNDSTMLQIALPLSKKSRCREPIDIDKEIEEDIQRELDSKAKKTSLTVKNVKSILRYVIGNESVLTMVRNAMKDAGESEDLEFQPKITRSKAKELRENNRIIWPLSPIKPPEPENNEHLVLIHEELPEEEDDEEYDPNKDEQEHSEDETGRQSVASSCNLSVSSSLFESFDCQTREELTLIGSQSETQVVTSPFKRPLENIGQRTRSKLSLSSTPLEAIEQAFIPPDITTDMYDFQCDNQEWENFLKDFMQPLPTDVNEVDEEDDPEYNILAEEEVVDQEELRQDKGVTVSRAELRTLMMELLEIPDEPSSDEEVTSKTNDDTVEAEPQKSIEAVEKLVPEIEPQVIGVTTAQRLLMQQHLRQHIQLIVQHFIQTHNHPLFSNMAEKCKIMIAELIELVNIQPNSVLNVCNLNTGFDLIEDWERLMMSENGDEIERFFKSEVALSRLAKSKTMAHRLSFHPTMLNFILDSDVFLYPLMLPHQPFRCDNPRKLQFLDSEDQLIALGLELFLPYVRKYPSWTGGKHGFDIMAIDKIHELLLTCKTTKQIKHRVRSQRYVPGNPIWYFYKHKTAPLTIHYVIPFDFNNLRTPREQGRKLLPLPWR